MIFCQFIPWEKKNVIWQTLMVYCLTLELFDCFRSFIVINSVLSEMVFIYFPQWESRIMYTSFVWLSTFFALHCRLDFKTLSWPTVHCMSQISNFRQFLHTFLSDYLSCQPCIKLIHHKIILFSNTCQRKSFMHPEIDYDRKQVTLWVRQTGGVLATESVIYHITFNSI